MTDEAKDVDPAEAFRAAAAEARKALATDTVEPVVAPSPEPGSSPASGAESVVPTVAEVATEGAKETITEVKPEGGIDPEAAWNEYKDEAERKKALAHNKAYAAEGWKKVKELEAKLAETPSKEEKPAEVVTDPEPADVPYDAWVKSALDKADTEAKQKVASQANEYNKFLAEKVAPAAKLVEDHSEKVRAAAELVKEHQAAMKFLQGQKDPALFEEAISQASGLLTAANIELNRAENAELRAKMALQEVESARLERLGGLRKDARDAHETEIKARKDSVSTKKAQEEFTKTQKAVDEAWETAKANAIKARNLSDEAAKEFLAAAADGAMIRAANANRSIPIDGYSQFIEESLKPFGSAAEKARVEAVQKVIETVSEPTPDKATAEKNVDAQPTNLAEWNKLARAKMQKAA